MSIHIQATYRDGVIYPEQPLDLANNTLVDVSLTPIQPPLNVVPQEEPPVDRPAAPRFTGKQLEEAIAKHGVSVGTLPPNFSRADIYQDHD